MNFKKAETPIWLIIALVLGVLVLVVIAIGFTTGWGQLWTRLTDWTGGGNSLSQASQSCKVACSSSDKPTFCSSTRTVLLNQAQGNAVVKKHAGTVTSEDGNKTIKGITCNQLSEVNVLKADDWLVDKCSAITC